MNEFLVRRYAAACGAGAILGAFWVGVVGRVVMGVIALLNDEAHGIRSDDDFVIGQFTFGGSLNFLVFGIALGSFGGALYLALRALRIGPAWFQVLSISLAPAIVALAMIVHPKGVDFTLLEPVALSVILFLLVAWGYTASLAVLVERWLRPGGVAETAPRWLVGVALVPTVFFLPVTVLLVVGRFAVRLIGRHVEPAAWLARGALLAVFLLSVADLASDLSTLA